MDGITLALEHELVGLCGSATPNTQGFQVLSGTLTLPSLMIQLQIDLLGERA